MFQISSRTWDGLKNFGRSEKLNGRTEILAKVVQERGSMWENFGSFPYGNHGNVLFTRVLLWSSRKHSQGTVTSNAPMVIVGMEMEEFGPTRDMLGEGLVTI